MAETYISQSTKINSTSSTTIYDGVAGTAILNSINLSNTSYRATLILSVFIVKSSVSYSLISNVEVPVGSSLQILDAPLVCESGDTVTATVSNADNVDQLHVTVSALEITA